MSARLTAFPDALVDAQEPAWQTPDIDPANIPAELRDLDQWVVWRKATRKGKVTKVPFMALVTDLEASSTDNRTWATFQEAMDAATDPSNRLDGIGFVFSETDGLAGVDMDNCLEDGEVLPWAEAILSRLHGFAEVSPSGEGIKVFVRGSVPGGRGRKLQKLGHDETGAIECYDRGRYFTVTGNRLDSHTEIVDAPGQLAELHAEWFPPPVPDDQPRRTSSTPTDMDDRRVFDLATRARNGAKFAQLWSGDITGYPSKSEADLALCSAISFFTQDPAQVERIFSGSGLVSAKWSERADYRQRTIARSLERATTYDPGYDSGSGGSGSSSANGHQSNGKREWQAGGDPGGSKAAPRTAEELGLICFDDIQETLVDWLWPNRIPRGKITLLAGEGEIGKTFLTLDMIARMTTGRPWPDQPGVWREPCDCVFVTAEDGLGDTIKPRLRAMGADLSRVFTITTAKLPNGKLSPFTIADIGRLEEIAVIRPGLKFIGIDPISSFLGSTDENKNAELRGLLGPLSEFSEKHDVAIAAITHFGKSHSAKATNKILGSVAYSNAARVTWSVVADMDNPDRRLMLRVKNNLSPNKTGMAYTLVDGVVTWEPDPVTMTANEFFEIQCEEKSARREGGGKRGPAAVESVKMAEWLFGQLSTGSKRISSLIDLAREEGLLKSPDKGNPNPSKTPLYNAADRIAALKPGWGVVGETLDNRKWWTLSKTEAGTDDITPGHPF